MDRKLHMPTGGEMLYLLSFSILLVRAFIYTTMLSDYFPSWLGTSVRAVAYMILMLKIIRLPQNTAQALVAVIAIGAAFLMTYMTSYNDIWDYIFCSITARNVSYPKMIKTFVVIEVIFTAFTILLSLSGMLENLVYIRTSTSEIRQALGFVYPTNFAAHIFFIACGVCYLNYRHLRLYHAIPFGLTAFVMYLITNARMDTAMTFLVFLMTFYTQKREEKGKRPMPRFFLLFSVPISAALSFLLVNLYDRSSLLWTGIDFLFSGRLRIGSRLMQSNGVSLFGQYIQQKGNGHGIVAAGNAYTYIDISYMRILLMCGAIIFVLVLLLSVYMNWLLLKKQNYIIPVIVLAIAINSMIAQHYLDFSYNPFLLSIGAALPIDGSLQKRAPTAANDNGIRKSRGQFVHNQ